MTIVADASPLIALLSVDRIDLLRSLYGEVVTTSTVRDEVEAELPSWLQVITDERDPLPMDFYGVRLDPGELSAIRYAESLSDASVLMDERKGRRVCDRLQLPVTGTIGILQAARRAGHIEHVRPLLLAIRREGLFISDALVAAVLSEEGERLI